MPVPAAVENGENMIKRLNAGILGFIKRIKFRSVGATILGGFAGLSLNSNILPSVMSYAGITDTFSARWALGGYAVYSIMAWSVGGWAAQRTGSRRLGAVILGFVGLVSGTMLTGYGISTGGNALLYGGAAATLYGAVGGMIIADALRQPAETKASDTADKGASDKNRATHGIAKKRDGWFRFFK